MSDSLGFYVSNIMEFICGGENAMDDVKVTPITFEILGPPLIKKNSKTSFVSKSGKMVIIGSKKFMANIDGQLKQLEIQKMQQAVKLGIKFPIEKNCFVFYDFYLNKLSKCDTNNLIANPDDMLQGTGVIADDFQLIHLPCSRIWAPKDKCKEKTVVTILVPDSHIEDFSGKWYRDMLLEKSAKEIVKNMKAQKAAENKLAKLEKENAKQNKKIEKISKAVIPSAPAEAEVEELDF